MSIETHVTGKRYEESFEHYLGVKFLEYGSGRCKIELKIEGHMLNIGGTVHGGIISALLDIAMSGAVTSNYKDQVSTEGSTAQSVVTLEMKVNYLAPGMLGDTLITYAEVIKKGSTIVFVEGGIQNQSAKNIARASGNWFVKDPSKNAKI